MRSVDIRETLRAGAVGHRPEQMRGEIVINK